MYADVVAIPNWPPNYGDSMASWDSNHQNMGGKRDIAVISIFCNRQIWRIEMTVTELLSDNFNGIIISEL